MMHSDSLKESAKSMIDKGDILRGDVRFVAFVARVRTKHQVVTIIFLYLIV
jgi:hypothetical protein